MNFYKKLNSAHSKAKTQWWHLILILGIVFTIGVAATGETHDKIKLSAKINESKNDSPFALKKSDSSDMPRDSVELNYTIDY